MNATVATAMTNLPAICLAVAGAVALAWSSVLQHEGVARSAGPAQRLTSTALGRCIRDIAWLGGVGLLGVGVALHVVAVALAPVSLVQPVGVLAVPLVVLLRGRRSAAGPGENRYPPAWLAVAATVVVVVVTAGASQPDAGIDEGQLAVSVVATAVAVTALGALGMAWRSHLRGLALAAAAGIAYGLGTALVRGLVVIHRDAGWDRPVTLLALGVTVSTCYSIGAWFVQQAYLASAPEAVMGTLTVVDPVVAVLVGFGALGEGAALGPDRAVALVAAALVATLAVARLSRPTPPRSPWPVCGSGPSSSEPAVRCRGDRDPDGAQVGAR